MVRMIESCSQKNNEINNVNDLYPYRLYFNMSIFHMEMWI